MHLNLKWKKLRQIFRDVSVFNVLSPKHFSLEIWIPYACLLCFVYICVITMCSFIYAAHCQAGQVSLGKRLLIAVGASWLNKG